MQEQKCMRPFVEKSEDKDTKLNNNQRIQKMIQDISDEQKMLE